MTKYEELSKQWRWVLQSLDRDEGLDALAKLDDDLIAAAKSLGSEPDFSRVEGNLSAGAVDQRMSSIVLYHFDFILPLSFSDGWQVIIYAHLRRCAEQGFVVGYELGNGRWQRPPRIGKKRVSRENLRKLAVPAGMAIAEAEERLASSLGSPTIWTVEERFELFVARFVIQSEQDQADRKTVAALSDAMTMALWVGYLYADLSWPPSASM
jgi:hypothetical protein